MLFMLTGSSLGLREIYHRAGHQGEDLIYSFVSFILLNNNHNNYYNEPIFVIIALFYLMS